MTLTITNAMPIHDLKPRIVVIGVGGAGGNAVENMIRSELEGVEFLVANTDAQALALSSSTKKIQLGITVTQGLGAGSRPDIGRVAAEEGLDQIVEHLQGSHMVFITAGMGGGTGTGAAPVIARAAREMGVLTVGVVTKPFHFEGAHRMRVAEQGIQELTQYVDTLIIIPNQNLFRVANEKTTFANAFKMADDVLHAGVRGVTDLMVMPGLINLDFSDIRTVMAEMGKAMMGTGEAEGENRAIRAAEAAINNPLLEDTSMAGARGLLINITGGEDLTLFEVDQAANRIREEVDEEANVIFGSAVDESLTGKIRVSVVATGIDTPKADAQRPRLVAVAGGAMPAPQPIHVPNGMQSAVQAAPAPIHGIMAVPGPLRHATPMSQPDVGPAQDPAGETATTNVQPHPMAGHAGHTAVLRHAAPQPIVRPGLFPEARQPAAVAVPAPAAMPMMAPPAPEAHHRPSLFTQVTGAFRRRHYATTPQVEPPPAQSRREPHAASATPEPQPEVARVAVRQPTPPAEATLEIPAFLRRQSS